MAPMVIKVLYIVAMCRYCAVNTTDAEANLS